MICGAASKGRSSSFRLNSILRSMLPYLVFANIVLGLIWVETAANPADYPSRFSAIPPALPLPRWLKDLGIRRSVGIGWELFAGSARLAMAHLQHGIEMGPAEILRGSDVMCPMVDLVIRLKQVSWVWLAPPCGSFSPLRNLDIGGPLRPKGRPEGDEGVPEVALGNKLWRRAIELATLCWSLGIYFFIEHPRGSKAWLLWEIQCLMQRVGVKLYEVDWCMYDDDDRVGDANHKPTRIMTTAPWFESVVRKCDGEHVHGPPLRGARAKAAGAYPTPKAPRLKKINRSIDFFPKSIFDCFWYFKLKINRVAVFQK